jgi:hypothetical protein
MLILKVLLNLPRYLWVENSINIDIEINGYAIRFDILSIRIYIPSKVTALFECVEIVSVLMPFGEYLVVVKRVSTTI